MAEECTAISPAVLQAAHGQGTSSSLLLNFRSPNTLFPDLPLMRSWIASLVFCGNSSGKLGFLCMALARLWQLLFKIGLLLGKISCAEQPGARLVSIGASDWWRWESCRELHSYERASPFGGLWGGGGCRLAWWCPRHFLEFLLSHDSCLRNISCRFIADNPNKRVRQKGNLCCPVTREEQRNKRIPRVRAHICKRHHWFHLPAAGPRRWWAPWTSLKRETEIGHAGEGRKGAQAAE